MSVFRLAVRNTLRHPLRSGLTCLGIAIALLAFCIIQTMIDAWYAGVKQSARNRLVIRNAASLVFYLPFSYVNTVSKVPGVSRVGYANWFGGNYKDGRYRFAQFAADSNYFDIYPEFILTPEERSAYEADRKGALIGLELAEKLQLKVGDAFQLEGAIFPGMWEFVVRGVFTGRDESIVTRNMLFHWDYLNERNKREINRQPDHIGFMVVELVPGADPAQVSKAIDELFANSYAETLTETETAFQQSFVSMSSTIILALNIVSFVVVAIMLLVLTNTMLMAARERSREYSVLKALGFGPRQLAVLLFGEAATICGGGLLLLVLALIPIFSLPARDVLGDLSEFFPVFRLSPVVFGACVAVAGGVAFIAGFFPYRSTMKLKVSDGLRRVG